MRRVGAIARRRAGTSLGLLRGHTPRLIAVVLASGASALLAAASPLPLGLLIDNALGGEPVEGRTLELLEAFDLPTSGSGLATVAAVAFGALAALLALSTALTSILWAIIGNGLVERLATAMFDRSVAAAETFHRRVPVADQLVRVSTDSWALYTVANLLVGIPSTQIITMVTVAVAAWHIDAGLTLVVFLLAPTLAIIAKVVGQHLTARSREEAESRSELAQVVRDTTRGLPDVLHLGAAGRQLEIFEERGRRWRRRSLRRVTLNVAAESVNTTLAQLVRALTLVLGGMRVLEGSLTLGTLVVFLGYAEILVNQTRSGASFHREWRNAKASLDRVDEILGAELRARQHRAAFVPLPSGGLEVELYEVSYAYDDHPALVDVSLRAVPGTVTALVGPTGAGKTTLVSLLPRLIDPDTGSITIGGIDHRLIDVDELRRAIAVVRQDPYLFPTTVADNIAYGRPDATFDEIQAAAAAANAHQFITELPDGYQTILGDGGTGLSGGQRQRLAIARALLKDAPILILDEPTSALDAETESEVMDAIDRLIADRTVLVIAHRLSTVRSATNIVVLDHGRIREHGTHDQLIERSDLYHTLYTTQFRQPEGARRHG